VNKILEPGLKYKSVMVGDMDLDIISGREAGVYICGVTYGIGSREDILKADPDYIIDDILELKDIVG
jgi:phosphoglycolate phosphatase